MLYDLETGKRQPNICDPYCYATAGSGPEWLKYEFSFDEKEVYVASLNTLAAWSLQNGPKREMFVDPGFPRK